MGNRRQCFFGKIWKWFLTVLGDIKVYRFPMFMVYDPTTFLVKGYHTREAINVLEPGCIVLRGYKCYADGFFIPGIFSHSSIYIGNNKIIHAIAEGVQEIDVIDFLRCDRFCILRPKDKAAGERAVEIAKSFLGTPYDFEFLDGNSALYCHELTANCFLDCDVKKQDVRIFGIKMKPRYTCDSFLKNDCFEKVLEVIPK